MKLLLFLFFLDVVVDGKVFFFLLYVLLNFFLIILELCLKLGLILFLIVFGKILNVCRIFNLRIFFGFVLIFR